MMNEETARAEIKKWNDSIDRFIQNDLPKLLEAEGIKVTNGQIPMSCFFKARAILDRQNFYEKGRALQMELRMQGYDVKMDMQSDKLVF